MVSSTNNKKDFSFKELKQGLKTVKNKRDLYDKIVNLPFQYKIESALLFLGTIVLLLVNEDTKTIDRVSLSNTPFAKGSQRRSSKRFEDIKIPINHTRNIITLVVKSGKPQQTTDWKYLFVPELTAQEARLNQASSGIGFSAVYPLKTKRGGALIFSFFQYADKIDEKHHEFMRQYSSIVEDSLNQLSP